MGSFNAVFFDLKGTLWDNVSCDNHVMGVLLPRLMPHLPEKSEVEEVRRVFNAVLLEGVGEGGLNMDKPFSMRDRFGRLLARYGVNKPDLARELSSHYNSARRFAMRGTVQKGVRSLLTHLHSRDIVVGVITNGGPAVQRQLLRRLGLDNLLDYVISGVVEGYRKPDPRLFRRALEISQVAAERMLYVGDSLFTDVYGARKAGLPVAWFRGKRESLIPANLPAPNYTISELCDVTSILGATPES